MPHHCGIPTADGARVRTLDRAERPFSSGEVDLPLVVEPTGSGDPAVLGRFLGQHGEAVLDAVRTHGAVLLRGFRCDSAQVFERAVLSIRGLRPMTGYFMSEPGRTRMEGTTAAFHTNLVVVTGGGFYFGGFHCENYLTADVPSIQSFCCLEPPALGGETALVHMGRAYEELGAALRARLESAPACAFSWPASSVAARYGCTAGEAEELWRSLGMPVLRAGAEAHLVLLKPPVLRHPVTGRCSLQVNVSIEVEALDLKLLELFWPEYAGARWSLHRLGWTSETAASWLAHLTHLPLLFRSPRVWARAVFDEIVARARSPRARLEGDLLRRVGERFEADDVDALARAIHRHTSVFTWRRGDVLIFDNLQTLHAGMPGFGRRELAVLLCNPAPIPYPVESGLVELGPDDGTYEGVEARFVRTFGARRARS